MITLITYVDMETNLPHITRGPKKLFQKITREEVVNYFHECYDKEKYKFSGYEVINTSHRNCDCESCENLYYDIDDNPKCAVFLKNGGFASIFVPCPKYIYNGVVNKNEENIL